MGAGERADRVRNEAQREFDGDALSTGAVRRFLSGVLDDWGVGLGPIRDDALLLASELAANAAEHATNGFTVRIRTSGTRARVEVRDTETTLPKIRQPTIEADRGRGLVLVNRLASAWGAEPAAGGKIVWFELPLVPDGPA
jgi:anti-sigma regulatory factor (Ser/Thr protein kinase)